MSWHTQASPHVHHFVLHARDDLLLMLCTTHQQSRAHTAKFLLSRALKASAGLQHFHLHQFLHSFGPTWASASRTQVGYARVRMVCMRVECWYRNFDGQAGVLLLQLWQSSMKCKCEARVGMLACELQLSRALVVAVCVCVLVPFHFRPLDP